MVFVRVQLRVLKDIRTPTCAPLDILRTALIHILWRESMAEAMGGGDGIDTIWSGYNFILGFLIVFRSTLVEY